MDSWELLQFLEDIAPPIEVIEGRVFLNRNNLNRNDFIKKISDYDSIYDAQKWINIVPVDDYLSKIIDNWDESDPNIFSILAVYRRSWLSACAVAGVNVESLTVNCLKDSDTGDVAFQLEQGH
jgi:hypothetical protein